MLDSYFNTTWQIPFAYAVHPTKPALIYELVSLPGFVPGGLPVAELYKSTDGGTTWHTVLKKLRVGGPLVSLLLAHEKPDLLYLNMDCSSPQAFQLSGHPFALLQPFGAGTFRWCTSSDSGANWRQVTAPARRQFMGTVELSIPWGGSIRSGQGRTSGAMIQRPMHGTK